MSRETRIRLHVRYAGRVQGVGFRATCQWIASSHPVTGWVRNQDDGSVLLEAQGAPGAVEAFLESVATQMVAKIAHSDRSAVPLILDETGFEIVR